MKEIKIYYSFENYCSDNFVQIPSKFDYKEYVEYCRTNKLKYDIF